MLVVTARNAADLLMPLFAGAAAEGVAALHVGEKGVLLAIDEFSGEAQYADLPIRAILRRALNLGAHGLVVAHNHPSGNLQPSAADIAATRRLAAGCRALDIVLHDHLIIAAGECESLRRLGLL